MAEDAGASSRIDRLYAVPLDEFVKRRDELARSLRAGEEREAAAEVKKLHKPTVAAWAVNQLARREKMRLRGLFTAGERLRAAHGEVLGGGSPELLERARDDERRAVEELVGAARTVLEEAGTPTEAVLGRVRETLHAAVVDESLGERVRDGRLEKEEQAIGFGVAGLPAPAPAGGARKPKQKAAREDAGRKRRQQAEERLREARAALVAAENEMKSRKRELASAERELESRRVAVERAQRELERTR